MEIRTRVNILGRERDFETLEFSLQFGFGGLGDEGQLSVVFSVLLEFGNQLGFSALNKGNPTLCEFFRSSSHCYRACE